MIVMMVTYIIIMIMIMMTFILVLIVFEFDVVDDDKNDHNDYANENDSNNL